MIEIGLRLCQRRPRRSHLRLRIDGLARNFAAGLAFGGDSLVQLRPLAQHRRVGGLASGGQIVTLDQCDQLPGLNILPLFYRQGLNPSRNLRTDLHFIRIYGADQLQVT